MDSVLPMCLCASHEDILGHGSMFPLILYVKDQLLSTAALLFGKEMLIRIEEKAVWTQTWPECFAKL